jgi:hypothetical protein
VRLGRIQPAAGRRFGIRCGISLVTIGSVERKSGGFAWFVVGSHIGQRSGFARIGRVKRIGRLPHLAPLDADTLAAAFTAHFDVTDFR